LIDVSPPEIQLHYVDALGRRHRAAAATLAIIKRIVGQPSGRGEAKPAGDVIVVLDGETPIVGPAEIQLEDGTTRTVQRRLPSDIPLGYHHILRKGSSPGRLIVAPRECFLPPDLRGWGWAIQLYASRSRRSWGIGDLADLRRLNTWAAADGAGFSLISPLAAPAPLVPQQASPYFPSSRLFRNPLYLDIEALPGARRWPGLAALARRGRALNRDRHIDRDAVFHLKMKALEHLWAAARDQADDSFDGWVREQGSVLRQFATFCALAERHGCGWHAWPAALRHPGGAAVRRASADQETSDRIRFHQWVQYQLDRQLARAAQSLPVMQDLPIGFDVDGADAWAFQDVLADGISVGAPPDEFNTRGQDWGLPPFVPGKLRAAGYEPFAQTIRACLRHAGGLRIDHVMGLFRLFWIPSGMEPAQGAYVRMPASDLLAIVALESQRARAVIVGEDLGTVEQETRDELSARKILSYRLVWFEKSPPSSFPEQALSAITTHDLPTIAGLWSGSDIEAQRSLRLAPNEAGTQEIHQRVARMTDATKRTPLATVITRLHVALATAPSRLLTATLDDAMAVPERPNMPATTDEWPNWCIALPRPVETLRDSALARGIARALARQRKSADRPPSR
jgi:4-alpha-glucanotransferase